MTAFTAAHSLTLSLAALGVLRVSARIIEPAIAASVVLAAANNLRPLFGRERWAVAFALGLLHGFGFSGALASLGLEGPRLLPALLGFNLGVELGPARPHRRCSCRSPFCCAGAPATGGSPCKAARWSSPRCALVWLVERAFEVSVLSWFPATILFPRGPNP